jgi:hypothetical protein
MAGLYASHRPSCGTVSITGISVWASCKPNGSRLSRPRRIRRFVNDARPLIGPLVMALPSALVMRLHRNRDERENTGVEFRL